MFKNRPLKIFSSPVGAGIFFLGSLAFAAWGIWFAGLGPGELEESGAHRLRWGHPWFGWATAVFFGYGALVFVRDVFDRSPQLLVQDEGLTWRRWSGKEIPWREISDIELTDHRGSKFIVVRLKNPARYRPRFPFSILSWFGKTVGGGDLAIPTAILHRLPEDIFDTIDYFWRKNR